VKCIYYDIGCKKELRRKDIYAHEQTNHAEHTRLIYQNLTKSNGEIKLQNDTMKQEIFDIKQENDTMKQEIVVLKKDNVTMKQDNVTMKRDNVTMKKDNVTMKQENDKLKKIKEELVLVKEENAESKKKFEGEINVLKKDLAQLKQQVHTRFQVHQNDDIKNQDSKTSDKIDFATNEIVLMKSKEEVKNMDSLKKKLSKNMSLCGKVSLSKDAKVLNIKCNNSRNISMLEVSKCYETNKFDWLLRNFSLMDNKSIIMELINNTKYHFYEYYWYNQHYMIVFPLDLNHIKDTEVVVPDMFKMKIIDNEIMVNILIQKNSKNVFLFIENGIIQLDHQKKLNLKQLDGLSRSSTSLAKGYAFLYFFII